MPFSPSQHRATPSVHMIAMCILHNFSLVFSTPSRFAQIFIFAQFYTHLGLLFAFFFQFFAFVTFILQFRAKCGILFDSPESASSALAHDHERNLQCL